MITKQQCLDKAQLVVSGIFVFLLPLDSKFLPPLIGMLVVIGMIQFNKTLFFKNTAKYKPYFVFFVLFFLWQLVSLIWTSDIPKGLKAAEHKVFYIIAPLLFLLYKKWPRSKLIKIFIFSNFLICLFCFGNLVHFFIDKKMYFIDQTIREGINLYTFRYVAYHVGANFISFGVHRLYFSFMIITSLLFLVFHPKCFKSKTLKYTMTVVFIVVILILQSKISVILFSLLLLYTFIKIFRRNTTKKRVVISVVFIAIVSIGYYLTKIRFNQFINQMNEITENNRGSLIERYQYNKCSLELIQEAPFFGYGAGDVGHVIKGKLIKYDFTYLLNQGVYDPHNEFLKAYISMGILGFLFLAGAFISIFNKANKDKNTLLLFYIGFVFIICLIEPFLSRQLGILSTLFFMGLLVDDKKKLSKHGH